MKSVILSVAKQLGLFAVASSITRAQIRIIAYHGIWFRDGHYGNHLFMSPKNIQSRIYWLKKSKYQVVPLGRALDGLKTRDNVPYETVITIDDGWYDPYKYLVRPSKTSPCRQRLTSIRGAVDSQIAIPNILIPALIHLSGRANLRFTRPGAAAPGEFAITSDGEKQIATSEFLNTLENLTDDQAAGLCRKIADGLGFDYDEIVRSRQFGLMTYDEFTDASKRGIDIQLYTDSHRFTSEAPKNRQRN